MITLVRLEAEATDLATIVKDIDAAEKALKVPKDLVVHDEHYERVAASGVYKGRRVFKRGAPPALTTGSPQPYYKLNEISATGASGTTTVTGTLR